MKQDPVSIIQPEITWDSVLRDPPSAHQSSHFHFHQSICPPLLLPLAGLMWAAEVERTLCLKLVPVWLSASPVSLAHSLKWGGEWIARLSQEQARLMDVSNPLTSTFSAYLSLPPSFSLYHSLAFSFVTECYIFQRVYFPFSYFTQFFEHKSFSTSAFNFSSFNYKVCHQLLSHYPLRLQVQLLAQ